MANSMQSVDPTLLALQTAKTATENAKKKVLPSLSTQVIAKPSLNVQTQQPQAISAPPTAKVGGISSPFGATNINSSPILGGATPTEIKETATELQSLPKTMPETGATEGKKISKTELKAILDKMPDNESRKLAITKLQERGHQIEGLDYEGGQKDNFITNLGSGIGQSVAGFGNLGKKLAFGAVDLYRQSQGKEKLTPEQRASVESTPMGQALNTITNRQTPEQKASVGGQIGMVAGSVAQGAALGTPISNAVSKIPGVANIVSKIPGVANIVSKAPVLSKIAGGIGQGLEGQALYSLSAEGKLPTGKELFTAGAFGGAVNAIGPIAKGIKENIKKLPSIKGTSIASKADDRANQMLTNMNRITKGEQEKFAVQQGKTVGQRLNDKGIVSGGEETIDALAKGFKNSIAKADEGLAAIRGNYKDKYLSTMANEAADFAENTLSPQASQIRALAQKADDVGLTMSETNEIKRFYERNNKFTYGKDITAGEKTVRATNLDNLVREWQLKIADENGLSNLREINKDTQGYRELLNKLIKNENGRLGNNAVTLTDWIVAGEVASNPSALALLVGKKIGGSKWFRSGMVKILNRLSGHTNEADKIIDIGRIMQIQDEKDLNKFLSLPLKQNADNFTPTSMNSASSNQGMVKTPGGIIPPKPTPKTPPITVEKGAIGMGTPKANNTPVIPPKATVAPSVGAPKVDTFKRMTELDSNPLYRKLTGGEILGGGKIKQGLFETPLGTITNEIMDGKVKKYVVNGKTYNASDLGGIREKQAPEVVAQANIASKAISDLKAIEKGNGKVTGSSLRSVLDELGIDKVDNIPEGAEAEVLKMVRARSTPPAPKGFKGLGKETMEQNITKADDSLMQEAKKYKSAEEFVNSKNKVYHGTNNEFDIFELSTNKTKRASSVNSKAVFFADDKDSVKYYGKNIKSAVIDKSNLFDYKNADHIKDLEKYLEKYSVQDIQPGAGFGKDSLISFLKKGDYGLIESKLIQSYIKKKGFDGFIANDYGSKDVYGILNLDKIKTEPQLKQIREQANKKPLPTLPKKGK